MIPSNWETTNIGKIAKVTSGGTPNRNQKDYWDGDIPWITTSLIDFNSIQKADEYISKNGLSNSSAKLFPPTTILMAMYGQGITRGRVATLEIEAATNQACAAILVYPSAYYKYVYYFLASQYNQIREIGHGGNQKNLNGGLIKNINIALPPLKEQKKIAKILSTWDKAIQLTQELIEAKEERKKGLMQRLLTGQVRFPGFERPWRNAKLKEFFYEFSKKNSQSLELTPLSCSKIYGIVPQSTIFDKRIASQNTNRYKIVEKGDLVYDPMLLWDASISFVESVEKGVISPAYNTFKFKESSQSDKIYFKHLFKSYLFKHYYTTISQGTNVRRRKAPSKAFLNLSFPIPHAKEEQAKISRFLDTCDQEIELLKQKLTALQEQKKGLMQRLLTGQVRVPVEEKIQVTTINVPTANVKWDLSILAKVGQKPIYEAHSSGSHTVDNASQPMYQLISFLRSKLKVKRLKIDGNISWEQIDDKFQVDIDLKVELFTSDTVDLRPEIKKIQSELNRTLEEYLKINTPPNADELVQELFNFRQDLQNAQLYEGADYL